MQLLQACGIVLFGMAIAGLTSGDITCEQKRIVLADIQKTILDKKQTDEDGKEFFPFIASYVRLAFHMCTGRLCLGCINLQDSSNFHLEEAVASLVAVQQRNPFIRHGDLWAWAAIQALQTAEQLTNNLLNQRQTFMRDLLVFRVGREDCPTAPFTDEFFPFASPTGDLDSVKTFFFDNFNFTVEETIAIIGAHKLGGLRRTGSTQIANQWVNNPNTLDNSFYINLINASNGWFQSPQALCSGCTPLNFWTNSEGKRLMFNTDMSLAKNINLLPGAAGTSACGTFASCSNSPTASVVADFAISNDRWLRVFAQTFMKLVEFGYTDTDLSSPSGC